MPDKRTSFEDAFQRIIAQAMDEGYDTGSIEKMFKSAVNSENDQRMHEQAARLYGRGE